MDMNKMNNIKEMYIIPVLVFLSKPYWIYKAKHEKIPGKKFDAYLKSIGGLKNGFFTDKPPIYSHHFCEVGNGWLPLIQDLINDLIKAGWNKEICQIKSKFAGLRFYINDSTQAMNEIIKKYESKSFETCEICGQPGRVRHHDKWLVTNCNLCEKTWSKERKLKIKSKNNKTE